MVFFFNFHSLPIYYVNLNYKEQCTNKICFSKCNCPIVEHHVHTNDPRIDPEKGSGITGFLSLYNVLRVNPLDKRRPWHLGQHVLFLVYIILIYAPLLMIMSLSKYWAPRKVLNVVARNFCLALPGCCLAKHAYHFWGLCNTYYNFTHYFHINI